MIFVTVGTHEQPFNRLIEFIDELKRDNVITEDVVIQTGYSTYEPQYCEWQRLFPYKKMQELVKEARIIITHGGPSSFIMPLQVGKIPIVVPRQKQFGEHINNHQKEFCKEVFLRQENIICVENVNCLGEIICNYEQLILELKRSSKKNNEYFCKEFELLVNELFMENAK